MRKHSWGFSVRIVLTRALLDTAVSSYIRFLAFAFFSHHGKELWQMEAGRGPLISVSPRDCCRVACLIRQEWFSAGFD